MPLRKQGPISCRRVFHWRPLGTDRSGDGPLPSQGYAALEKFPATDLTLRHFVVIFATNCDTNDRKINAAFRFGSTRLAYSILVIGQIPSP